MNHVTHIVQFTTMTDFIADLAAGETAAIYHQLIEQRTATSDHGLSRWQLATIIRALVANSSSIIHVAALTIPHGAPVTRVNGRLLGPPGAEDEDLARWRTASERHDDILDVLCAGLDESLLTLGLVDRLHAGILYIPNDLAPAYAANPLDEPVVRASK